MATEGGGKVKPKRGHSTSKPYERRKSLLGKVKDKMRNIIAPSWLTDLVSSGGSKVSSESPDRKDAIAEEEEDIFMSPAQSPSQLNSCNKPVQSSGETDGRIPPLPTRTTTSVATTSTPAPSTSSGSSQAPFSSSHLPFSKFTSQKARFEQIPNGKILDDNMSERSDISRATSRCSSMMPHPDRREYQREILQLNESALEQLKEDLQVPAVMETKSETKKIQEDQSKVPTNRPQTWSAEVNRKGRPLAPAVRDKPSFNTSLFGSPVLHNSSILGESFHESSFYSGKTTFGGASAYRKPKLNVTAPYQTTLPIRKHIKPKVMNNSFNAVTSSTARRILETLERMSTPLTDAKKIPANESALADSVLSFTPGSYRRPSRPLGSASLSRRSFEIPLKGPPTCRIRTPSIASISKNRQTVTSVLTSSQILETRSTRSSQESEKSQVQRHDKSPIQLTRGDTVLLPDSPGAWGGGGKMKREKSYHHSMKRPDEELELPSLNTNFTLPVSSMPRFEFRGSPIVANKVNVSAGGSSSSETVPSLKFTFSTPIQKTAPETKGKSPPDQASGFSFSSPLKIDDTKSDTLSEQYGSGVVKSTTGESLKMSFSATPAFAEAKSKSVPLGNGGIVAGFKPASELKHGSVMDVLGKDKSAGGVPSTSDFQKGSVMDILGKSADTSDKAEPPPSGLKAATELKQGSVMDILGKKSESDSSPTQNLVFSRPKGSWDCPTCLVQNKSEAETCVACQANKPSEKTSSKNVTGSATGDFLAKFKKPEGSWDCGTCLVQNKAESTQCVACESPKPPPAGSGSISTGQSSLSAMFKKPSGSWECKTCLVQNTSETTKCVACQSLKPEASSSGSGSISSGQSSIAALFKRPTGSWECQICLVQNKSEASKCAACETPQPGLSGGSNSISSGLGNLNKLFKKPSGSWDCNTCLVQNKPESTKCVACETQRPGTQTSAATAPSSGGLNLGSSKGSMSESGGFKFGTGEIPGMGIKFGESGKSDSDKTNSGVVEGGFKFGNSDSRSSTEGFVFGSQNTGTSSGGFKFGQPKDSEKKPVQETENQQPGGFSFSAVSKENSGFVLYGEKDSGKSNSGTVPGGFSFGSVVEASKDKTNTKFGKSDSVSESAKGGFSFNQKTDSTSETKSKTPSEQSSTVTGSGVDFSFGSSQTKTVVTNSGLVFGTSSAGTSKTTDSSAGQSIGEFTLKQQGTSKTETVFPKPNFGGTGLGASTKDAKPVNSLQANASLFSFGQPVDKKTDESKGLGAASEMKTGFSFSGSTDFSASTGSKRGLDEAESGASAAKKSFTFGSGSGSSAVGTGAFVFNATSSGTAPVGNSVFKFGSSSSNGPSDVKLPTMGSFTGSFGSSSTSATTSVPGFAFATAKSTSTGSNFQFGSQQAGTTSNLPLKFGSQSAPSSTSTVAPFGSSNSLPQPTFGSTANAVLPAAQQTTGGTFGSSTPAFGSNNSTTPAFGTASAGQGSTFAASSSFGSTTNQSTGTGFNFNSAPSSFSFGGSSGCGVFQFSAKKTETPAGAPAQTTPSAGFTFGSQPQPAAPAPSFNATPAFNFSGSTTPGTFNFGANPSSETGSTRKIKKAIRKIRK